MKTLGALLLFAATSACLARAADDVAHADAAFLAGRAEEAQQIYEALVAAGSKDAHVHRNLAVIYDESHRGGAYTEKAEQLYRTAMALDAKDAEARFRLGLHLHADGKGRDAIDVLRQAVALDPRHAAAHYWLARLSDSYGEGTPDAREAMYRAAISADPGYADAYFFLARALVARGRTADALTVLRAGRSQPPRAGQKQPSDFDDEISSLSE